MTHHGRASRTTASNAERYLSTGLPRGRGGARSPARAPRQLVERRRVDARVRDHAARLLVVAPAGRLGQCATWCLRRWNGRSSRSRVRRARRLTPPGRRARNASRTRRSRPAGRPRPARPPRRPIPRADAFPSVPSKGFAAVKGTTAVFRKASASPRGARPTPRPTTPRGAGPRRSTCADPLERRGPVLDDVRGTPAPSS